MASEAQIAANRRNAQKSTGPKTQVGRAAASRSAVRHGLTARQVVAADESAEDFDRFREELRADLVPVDAVEEQLVERIVICGWRLRRAWRAEARLIAGEGPSWGIRFKGATGDEPPRHGLGTAFSDAAEDLAVLSRYEATIERALNRAVATLERRQLRRLEAAEYAIASNSTSPARVDVGGISGDHPATDLASVPLK